MDASARFPLSQLPPTTLPSDIMSNLSLLNHFSVEVWAEIFSHLLRVDRLEHLEGPYPLSDASPRPRHR